MPSSELPANAARVDEDVTVSLWGLRVMLTVVVKFNGQMRLNADRLSVSQRLVLADLNRRGYLRARDARHDEIAVSGTCFLEKTDLTNRILEDYEKSVQAGRNPRLTPFGDDVQKIIKA